MAESLVRPAILAFRQAGVARSHQYAIWGRFGEAETALLWYEVPVVPTPVGPLPVFRPAERRRLRRVAVRRLRVRVLVSRRVLLPVRREVLSFECRGSAGRSCRAGSQVVCVRRLGRRSAGVKFQTAASRAWVDAQNRELRRVVTRHVLGSAAVRSDGLTGRLGAVAVISEVVDAPE